MREIVCLRGEKALVDDQDFDVLNLYSWRLSHGYVVRSEGNTRKKGSYKTFYMHRVIMKPNNGQIIDHINMNTLDNRRENLRFCTKTENGRNSAVRKNNILGTKGIYYDLSRRKYRTSISVNKKQIFIGRFNTVEEAIIAYKSAVTMYFKDFAQLNLIKENK